MAQPNTAKKISSSQAVDAVAHADQTAEVLYQKMGDRWFAFSVIDDEVFVGSIPVEKIQELEQQETEQRSRAGRTFRVSGSS
jgi:hypothetical protein